MGTLKRLFHPCSRRSGCRADQARTGPLRAHFCSFAMAKQYNMYNVQLSEFWKQRVGKESLHNAPYLEDDEDDRSSVFSDARPASRCSRAPSEYSVTSEASKQKIADLQAKLDEERRKRIEVENQLKSIKSTK